MYRLRLFGGASLEGPSGPVTGRAGQRRPLAVLALVAVEGDSGLSRAKLVGHLWPETPEKRARHLLSVTLHAIRRALGKEAVLSMADELRLNSGLVSTDVWDFENAVSKGALERAVELYDGPLLDGFQVRDAREFERWIDRERAKYARSYRSALERLATASEDDREWAAAADWWHRLAVDDPYSSRVTLRLMRALDRSGDRPAAVRAARAHAKRTREELELDPDPEVLALAQRLENDQVERSGVVVPAGVEPSPSRTSRPEADEGAQTSREETPGDREAPGHGGREPESSLNLPRLVLVLVLLAGLGSLAASTVLSEEEPALDPKRVLVDVFENRTGDPTLDEMGRMAADWITQGLTYTGFVDVVTLGTPLFDGQAPANEGASGDGEGSIDFAMANGAGTIVWGSFHRRADSVYLRTHVTDARDRQELATLEPVAVSVEAPLEGLERLRDHVMASLATLTDPRLERWQKHASKPPTFEAYQTFVEGIELHTTHQRFAEAADVFRRAAALDSHFTMAKLWAVMALGNLGRWEEADPILEELKARRETLASLDQALLDYHLASKEGEEMDRLRAARRMVEIAPGSEYLKLAGGAALEVHRPAEALSYYERADPESGWLRGWTAYWIRHAEAHHRLGNFKRELEIARRGRELHPDAIRIRDREIRALAALGRLDELDAAIADAGNLNSSYNGPLLSTAARELIKHVDDESGRAYLQRAVRWYEQQLRKEGDENRRHRLTLVDGLRELGDLEEADRHLEVLLENFPDDPRVLRAAGQLRARAGRREEALEFLERFNELGELWYINFEPEIAALLGDREWALQILERFERSGGIHRPYYRHALQFRGLREDPRFQKLLEIEG